VVILWIVDVWVQLILFFESLGRSNVSR